MHDALSSSCLLLARVTGALPCLCGHWPDQSPVSLCPQTLGACAPRPCARAPSPLNTPQFILTSIKTFQSPLCRRCRHPVTPDSPLAPSLLCLFVSHAPDVAMGTDSRAELAITRFSKILRDAGQLRLNWPQAPALRTRPCHATQARDSKCPM